MSNIFTFPSGMKVEMRARSITKLRETLQKFKTDSIIGAQTAALQEATVKLVDVGDYLSDRIAGPDGSVNWIDATSEDRIAGLMATRIISFADGKHYKMECTCGRCDKKFVRNTDLRRIEDGGDIVYWNFEKEVDQRAFKEGRPFEGKLGDKLIKWRMLYGRDEELIERVSQNDPNAITEDLNLNARIISVEGIERNDVMGWISEIGDDRIGLEDMMSESSHGVDLTVDIKCPWCNNNDESSVPFDLEFWIPVVEKGKVLRRRRRNKALAKKGKKGSTITTG